MQRTTSGFKDLSHPQKGLCCPWPSFRGHQSDWRERPSTPHGGGGAAFLGVWALGSVRWPWRGTESLPDAQSKQTQNLVRSSWLKNHRQNSGLEVMGRNWRKQVLPATELIRRRNLFSTRPRTSAHSASVSPHASSGTQAFSVSSWLRYLYLSAWPALSLAPLPFVPPAAESSFSGAVEQTLLRPFGPLPHLSFLNKENAAFYYQKEKKKNAGDNSVL